MMKNQLPHTKIDKIALFHVLCWRIQIINFEKKKKELIKTLESYPEEKEGEQEFSTNRQSNRSGLAERFTSILNEEMTTLSKEIKKDFTIPEIWSISYDKGDSHSPHNHGSKGLTGILYLDLSKDSSETVYIQPWNDIVNDTVQYAKIPITEGGIVIVPSFVMHYSKPNKSKNTKRIISWNMKI